MKRRPPATLPTPGSVPVELVIGPCAEVWADDGADLIHAHRNHGIARRAWEAQTGVDRPTSYALLPGSSPWRHADPGGPARLARHGVSPAQLPELRAAAAARVAEHDHHHTRRN